jgi:transcriptional regulator with XRE-family HTH domain
VATANRSVGDVLRQWRERQRLSQLDLALLAEVSTRHLSFVETGRSTPSREMVLRLAEALQLPLRERNLLLLSAGYAPAYSETALTSDTPSMAAVQHALRQVLRAHEPYPALVVDRHWNLVEANASLAIFLQGVAPELLRPPTNVLRVSLHPRGMAPRILNLAEWRSHLLARLRRQMAMTADADLERLYAELKTYPYAGSQPPATPAHDVALPLRLRARGRELTFFSLVTSFGTPTDLTLEELAIESFLPADPATAAALTA